MPLQRRIPSRSQSPSQWEPYRKAPPTPPPTAPKQKNNTHSHKTDDATPTAPPLPSRVWSWGVLADKDPKLACFSRKSDAQKFNNQRIREIATLLAGPPPKPIGPHHKNHAVGAITVSTGGNDYTQLGRYFQLVGSIIFFTFPTTDEHNPSVPLKSMTIV